MSVRGRNAGQGEAAIPCYAKGDVRIRYEEAGAGFPLLVMLGGSLNSRISNWVTAPFNAMVDIAALAPQAQVTMYPWKEPRKGRNPQ